MSFSDRYVGLPYVEDGRGPEAFDCLGLAQLVFRQECGIVLPEHLADPPARQVRGGDGSLADHSGARWAKVAPGEERAFDMVLVRERPWHVGVVVRRGEMLHMPANRSAVVEPFLTARHAARVEGIYRHPVLA